MDASTLTTEFHIVGGVLMAYSGSNAEVKIPEGVLRVGQAAFKNNVAVKRVVFSSTVTAIENSAFEGCTNLTQISDYKNVESFGDDCFKFAGLTSVAIGYNVTHLGNGCFSRLPNLTYVSYMPEKPLKLNHTFAFCQNLTDVETDQLYFFPAFRTSLEVRNNPNRCRPTFSDAFVGTPYIRAIRQQYYVSYKQGICPECGCKIKKRLFHAKCKSCGIDYKN